MDGKPLNSVEKEIQKTQIELRALQEKLTGLRRQQPAEDVKDYRFQSPSGGVQLSELFGNQDDLILIHNMGASCSYCTLWADGFTGLIPHFENRAAFVLVSNDEVEAQTKFAESRGWNFKCVSSKGTPFFKEMGFEGKDGFWPGVSVFRRDLAGKITRVTRDFFGPGDLYCSLWHFFDLLPRGSEGWSPKYRY